MASLHPLLRLPRFAVAAVVVLMIGLHAMIPLGQPAGRQAGSAFSAETAEVSLRSGEGLAIVQQAEIASPPVASLPYFAIAAALKPVWQAQPPASPFDATGPPSAGRTSFSPLSPRAPPAA